MNKKCICFARVSTYGQDLTQQVESLLQHAKQLGYDDKDIIRIEFKESGIKLDEEDRKGLQQLKDEIEHQTIDCVIIYEISRISRRPKVLYSIRDYLIDKGINLICLKPYMQMLDPDGKLSQTANIMFSLFSAMSESEMMLKKERTKRGRIAKREKGYYIGGNMLFGYDFDSNNKIYIVPKNAMVVREIFDRYGKGESCRSIAQDLIDRGMLPYNDYSTAQVMLRRMIRRSEYAGIKQNTYDYPPIIDKETFMKVRKIADRKNKYKTRLKHCYWCQGIIYDKETGRRLSPSKATLTYKYWDEVTRSGYQINLNAMDSIVWYAVKRHKMNPKNLNINAQKANAQNKLLELHDKIIKARTTINEHKQTIDRINERIVKGKMSEKQGDNMIEETKKYIEALRINMIKWDSECSIYERQIRLIDNPKEYKMTLESMSDDQIKETIFNDVSKIELTNTGIKERNIEITFIDGMTDIYNISKRGNYFDIENEGKIIKDFPLIVRFIRKGATYCAGTVSRIAPE